MNRRRLLVMIALLGTFLRVAPALRDLDTVDRIFVPDDTYYTLAISRSLAACPLDTCAARSPNTASGVRTFVLIMACSTGHGSPAL